MLTDAHCHPFDLLKVCPAAPEELRRLGVLCAASATDAAEFEANEALAARGAALLPCFALHPQLPAFRNDEARIEEGLAFLETAAAHGRVAAIGETGFDLFNEQFRLTEKKQDAMFAAHLEIALRYDLPLVLHARRAMHKIFAYSVRLKKCRALVFHSWPGTLAEGEALLRRGLNGYFSFGTPIMLNHRTAMRCCALFPASRLLLETDAPYQPLRETQRRYSSWEDLPLILKTAAALRREAGSACADSSELEKIVERNFRAVFGVGKFSRLSD